MDNFWNAHRMGVLKNWKTLRLLNFTGSKKRKPVKLGVGKGSYSLIGIAKQ
jgi:hypothetical protein